MPPEKRHQQRANYQHLKKPFIGFKETGRSFKRNGSLVLNQKNSIYNTLYINLL